MKLFLLCLIAAAYCAGLNADTPASYWRDFKGQIPSDAVVAGLNKNKEKVYIGQALVYNKGIYGDVPGSFNKFPLEVVLEGVIEVDDYARILCSNAPNQLKWIRTSSESFTKDISAGVALVSGGVQKHVDGKKRLDEVLAIGRTVHAEEQLVGKLYVVNQTHVAFDYAQNGHRFTAVHFEVLAYV